MIDLKNTSVVQMRNAVALYVAAHQDAIGVLQAFDEMARRLRELEKDLMVFKQLHVDEVTWRERDKAALLACQARETELSEALKDALYVAETFTSPGGPASPVLRAKLEHAQKALSHSTGSKIMAVLEAERWVPISEELPLPYVKVLIANRTPDGYQVLIGFRNHNGDWKEPWGDNVNLDIPMVDFWKHKRPPELEAKHER